MSVAVRLEPREGYLHVVCTGVFNLLGVQRVYRRVLEACAEQGMARVLLDARTLGGSMTIGERYELAVLVADANRAHVAAGHAPVRLAVVAVEPLMDPGRFGEDVAHNRGADVKAVADPGEAAAWLGVDPHVLE